MTLAALLVSFALADVVVPTPASAQNNGNAGGDTGAGPSTTDGAATDGNGAAANTGGGANAGAPAGTLPGQYPPLPSRHFYRGNSPTGTVQPGLYLSLFGLLLLVGMLMIWARSAYWIDEDSRGLNLHPENWNTLLLLGGVAGFLAVLVVPMFMLGFVLLLGLYAVPFGLYVAERNKRVPESSKVFTPAHIQKVTIRTLAKVGIRIGSSEAVESAIGPPIEFIGKSQTGAGGDAVSDRQVQNSRGYLAAKELVYDAILRRATDVHLEPKEDELAARIRIDGVMYPTEPFDRAIGDAVVNIFKVLSSMDITEKRRPQDGSFRAELEGRRIDFRVATQGTRHGEKMSLRILDQANSVSTLSGLGLRKALNQQLTEIFNSPHGLFLACGPTGAGKSTTLYAALNEIDSYQRNIITVEDPVEYKMENVNQIEINTKSGQTFASSLRSILRQDPDVVMIGEIRDGETAEIACQAANTGHMVFSTIHANDTLTALYRLMELGVEPFMVANSISAIMAQRLARRLCPECKEAYRPKPEFLKKAGLPAEKIDKFYRPPREGGGDCPKCGGLGFFGRVGVYELLTVTERMRDMIREKAPLSSVKAEARKNGMLTMKEEGLRLVVRGTTSIDELLRVVK